MILSRRSPFSGKVNTMVLPITEEQLLSYENGDRCIQEVFPNLTPAQREFIMTGITEDEWPSDDEEDDN